MMHASVSGAQCIRSVWSVNGVSGSVSGGGVSEVVWEAGVSGGGVGGC